MIGKLVPYVIMIATAVLAFWRDAPYASLLFLLYMAAWYTTRLVLTQGEENSVTEERHRLRERCLTTGVFIGMVVLPILTLATPLMDFAVYQPFFGQIPIGICVGCLGVFVFWRSHADLGKNWSAHLELRKEHYLVTNGIYARIRHPMYAAIFLITIAQVFLLSNWIAGPLGLITFTLLYLLRIESEEKMMRSKFGELWDSYAAETPRLIPTIPSQD